MTIRTLGNLLPTCTDFPEERKCCTGFPLFKIRHVAGSLNSQRRRRRVSEAFPRPLKISQQWPVQGTRSDTCFYPGSSLPLSSFACPASPSLIISQPRRARYAVNFSTMSQYLCHLCFFPFPSCPTSFCTRRARSCASDKPEPFHREQKCPGLRGLGPAAKGKGAG